jgi:hypothetical protein
MRARGLVIVVFVMSYGAVGARQPAVRTSVPLPAPDYVIAEALDLPVVDHSRFVLDIVRILFGSTQGEGETRSRASLQQLLATSRATGQPVPLPLDAAVWRETILQQQVPDAQIISAILSDRPTALVYYGLAGLNDETLAWLGPEHDTLRHLLRHPGAFAAFGPSLRIQAGKVLVPGGLEAEPMWQAIVGADPAKPSAFVRRLYADDTGTLAWFYDTLSGLDEPRFRFATGASLPAAARIDRVRALLGVFERVSAAWSPEKQPFNRRPLDPALTLAAIDVDASGTLLGPNQIGVWERVFSDDTGGRALLQTRDTRSPNPAAADAAWLLSRIHNVPADVGRRRLDAFLFAQRLFRMPGPFEPAVTTALRAVALYPALMVTLERGGVTSAPTLAAAAARAEGLSDIGDDQVRASSIVTFQATLGILDRVIRASNVAKADADALVSRLVQIDHAGRGYSARVASWIQKDLLTRLPEMNGESFDPLEDTLLAAMAGVRPTTTPDRVVEWEGRRYHVNAARAEELRLHRIRQRQGGASLQAALQAAQQPQKNGAGDRIFADTLTSILYAAYLGDPQGPALAAGNVALRHELGSSGIAVMRSAWRLPTEVHTTKGWRVTGSLLGLDIGLARLALRRLDSTVMPPEPHMVIAERQTASTSVALLNPLTLSDAQRDEIAAALARGRARLEALDANEAEIDRAARDAGLSAWRREALRWTIAHEPAQRMSQLSLVELMWLGRPRQTATLSLDGWGAAAWPLTGCGCLAMPRPQPWEFYTGRPSVGLTATRGADVSLLVADTLASLELPAQIAPGVIAYAMQEVLDHAWPAHTDDWSGFSRAAASISRDTLVDYIAAQTAGGSLLPAPVARGRQ